MPFPIILLLISLTVGCVNSTKNVHHVSQLSLQAPTDATFLSNDQDGDGLDDQLEQELAEKYAPIVYHSLQDLSFPTNVEAFLQHTQLMFYDQACSCSDRITAVAEQVSPRSLVDYIVDPTCSTLGPAASSSTWDHEKRRTFFLANVSGKALYGEKDSTQWTTYFHAYPNDEGGVTIQYWRFYAHDNGQHIVGPFFIGGHGGDWEGLHVVLNKERQPRIVRTMDHSDIKVYEWGSEDLKIEGSHPIISSNVGGHTSVVKVDRSDIRHETWTSPQKGHVTWPSGQDRWPPRTQTETGSLINLGEKTRPLQSFVRYSGLWGSVRAFDFISGYWGPAYNETGMRNDGFHRAWCEGMKNPDKVVAEIKECYSGR